MRLQTGQRLSNEELEITGLRQLARALIPHKGKLEPPHSVDLLRPGIGKTGSAGVVAEAMRLEDPIEASALGEIRRAETDHVRGRKRELRVGDSVVRPHIL